MTDNGRPVPVDDEWYWVTRKLAKLVLEALMLDPDDHWRASARTALARFGAVEKQRGRTPTL